MIERRLSQPRATENLLWPSLPLLSASETVTVMEVLT